MNNKSYDYADVTDAVLKDSDFFGRMGTTKVREDLYRLKSGRWILHRWSPSELSAPEVYEIDTSAAVNWVIELRASALLPTNKLSDTMRELETVPEHVLLPDDYIGRNNRGRMSYTGPPPMGNVTDVTLHPRSDTAIAIKDRQDQLLKQFPPTVVREGSARPFIMTELQTAIFEKLNGTAYKVELLASAIGCETSRLYKKGGLKELKEAGKVLHKHGVGYYRPDVPPPEQIC